jgi:hypothetical protein
MGHVYELVTVRLADRPQPVMVAPDTPWLKQAIADGLLIRLDQEARERSRDGAQDGGSAKDGGHHAA